MGVEMFARQLLLVLVQVVVHLPEMTLCGCGFGSLGGLFCVGMRTGDRKVAEDKAQAVPPFCAWISLSTG